MTSTNIVTRKGLQAAKTALGGLRGALRKHLRPAFALLAAATALTACGDEGILMNDSYIKNHTYAEMSSDATPLTLSTFKLDSVQTSSQNTAWVGKTTKPVIGTIHSDAYMMLAEPVRIIGLPDGKEGGYNWYQNGKEVYDSCTMVLYHSGLYEGDTTKNFEIVVKRLDQRLEFASEDESEFYNVRSFKTGETIGKYTFKPRPHTYPRVRFRLSDDYGEEVKQFIINASHWSSGLTSQYFRSLMKGIQITSSDENFDTKALIAFVADSSKICLHSHYRGYSSVKIQREFRMTGSNLQFNNVWNEGMDEPYDQLDQRYKQVTETEGGLHSVEFEGLGYYTRINFPQLETLKNLNEYQHVIKATLKIYPEVGSYDKRRIPTTFYLFEVNKGNVIQGQLRTASGSYVKSTLVYDSYDRTQMYYYADITYYINTLLAQDYMDENSGIVMTWGNGMQPTNYDFMLFNGHGVDRHRSCLEVTYYNYDREER
ncbi:MAG: DUF4270 family protein [Marinilabiliaceae bacterium]